MSLIRVRCGFRVIRRLARRREELQLLFAAVVEDLKVVGIQINDRISLLVVSHDPYIDQARSSAKDDSRGQRTVFAVL